MSDLRQQLHDERQTKNTMHVDCWACEAERSETIQALVKRAERSAAIVQHFQALADWMLSPEEQRALWRDFYRMVLKQRAEEAQP